MAKWKKTKVGSLVKSKDPTKPNYVKLEHNVSAGTYINFESKAFRLKDLEAGVLAGRIGPELEGKLRESIEKTPDFVIADGFVLSKE